MNPDEHPIRRPGPPPGTAVLRLGNGFLEWLESRFEGTPCYARVALEEAPTPQQLAQAARQAARLAGGRARRCILALSGDGFRQRTVDLPPMPRKQQKAVLLRKAAGLLDQAEAQTLFTALELAAERKPDEGEPGSRWLLLAVERSKATALQAALEHEGLRVVRTVSAQLGHLDAAQALRGDVTKACIVVDVEEQEVLVGLIAGERLHYQTRLRGDLARTPALGSTLLSELRTLDSFWRKESRGGRVEELFVLGLESDRGEALGHAAATVLPGARVVREPDGPAPASAGRLSSLACCAARGPFALDVSVGSPRGRRRATLAGALCVALALILGLWQQRGTSSRSSTVLARAEALAQRSVDLERLQEENRQVVEARASLQGEIERLERAAKVGLSVEECLSDALLACGNAATLLSLTLRSPWPGEPGELLLTGVTRPGPLESAHVLARLASILEASPRFASVEVLPPAALPDEESATAQTLEFAVSARCEGASLMATLGNVRDRAWLQGAPLLVPAALSLIGLVGVVAFPSLGLQRAHDRLATAEERLREHHHALALREDCDPAVARATALAALGAVRELVPDELPPLLAHAALREAARLSGVELESVEVVEGLPLGLDGEHDSIEALALEITGRARLSELVEVCQRLKAMGLPAAVLELQVRRESAGLERFEFRAELGLLQRVSWDSGDATDDPFYEGDA